MNNAALIDECTAYALSHGKWLSYETEQDFEMERDNGDMITFTATGKAGTYCPGDRWTPPYQEQDEVWISNIEVTPVFNASADEMRKLGLAEYNDNSFGKRFGDEFRIDVELNEGEVFLSHGTKHQRLFIRTIDELKAVLSVFGIGKELAHG